MCLLVPSLLRDVDVTVPLLLRDLVRGGTVPVAIAHAAGGLHALPGRGDGRVAVTGRPAAHT
jgi:hypothetical protein